MSTEWMFIYILRFVLIPVFTVVNSVLRKLVFHKYARHHKIDVNWSEDVNVSKKFFQEEGLDLYDTFMTSKKTLYRSVTNT